MSKIRQLTIRFFLNAELVEETISPEVTALNLLRTQFRLTGAKESCNEGDCGACTIALGSWVGASFSYIAINSCILPAAKLHGCHVITVEGLGGEDKLHLIQESMLENRATQCGYCTPGIVMSLFCLLSNNDKPTDEDIFSALEGNLCRCTGYLAIENAAKELVEILKKKPAEFKQRIFPEYIDDIKTALKQISYGPFIHDFGGCGGGCGCCGGCEENVTEGYEIPTTLAELFAAMEIRGDYKTLNGGSDLMVAANIQRRYQRNLLDISQIAELNFINSDNVNVVIGGATTLTEIIDSELIAKKIPVLKTALLQMASTQIRNIATLAGNIANASPIGDAACVALGLSATLVIKKSDGEREIALEDFYQGYKKIDLQFGEVIAAIKIPFPEGKCSFEKSSKRTAVDIATANSLLQIGFNGKKVAFCRIAFGGVAPYPSLAPKTAEFLLGKELSETNIEQAAAIAVKEFEPIADIRGSAQYRSLLIRNHIIKHLIGES